MLINFSIDPREVVRGDYSADEHARLLRYWVEHRLGLLVDLGGMTKDQALRCRVFAALNSIENRNIRDMWKSSWKKGVDIGIIHAVPEDGTDLGDYDSKAVKSLAPFVDFMVVEDGDPDRFSEHRFVTEPNGRKFLESTSNDHEKVEVVNFERFDFSDKTKQVQEMRLNGSIPVSSKVQDVWDERIKDYFNSTASKNIHIVDRYCLLGQGNTGLDAFIKLGKMEHPQKRKILHIYASMPLSPLDETPGELFNRVQLILRKYDASPDPFLEVHVHLVKDDKYGNIVADRWIRFGEWIVLLIGHGLEVLQGTGSVERSTTCTVHTGVKSAQEVEKTLKYAASESVVINRNLIKQSH